MLSLIVCYKALQIANGDGIALHLLRVDTVLLTLLLLRAYTTAHSGQ